MKRLISLMMCAASTVGYTQGTTIYDYPFNPDANGDNHVGATDLQSFLASYGQDFGLPPEPCDFQASNFEEFILGWHSGEIILDSIFVEYELEGIATYFEVGCPDPISDTIIFADAGYLYPAASGTCSYGQDDDLVAASGIGLSFAVGWQATEGSYRILFANNKIRQLGYVDLGAFLGSDCTRTNAEALPWPEDWVLDENGIDLPLGGCWSQANYLHIIPYAHLSE